MLPALLNPQQGGVGGMFTLADFPARETRAIPSPVLHQSSGTPRCATVAGGQFAWRVGPGTLG